MSGQPESADKMGDRMAALADAFTKGTGPGPSQTAASEPQPSETPEPRTPSPEAVAAQQRVQALEQQGQEQRRKLGRERVINSILTNGDYRPHDPELAIKMLGDLDAFVGRDGEVDAKALGDALRRLYADKPFLLKPIEIPMDLPVGPSAPPVGSGRRRFPGQRHVDSDYLRLKYPGL